MKTKVNVKNLFSDKDSERRIGVLDSKTQLVKTSNGKKIPLKTYEENDINGVGFFETRDKGKIVKKAGKFHYKVNKSGKAL